MWIPCFIPLYSPLNLYLIILLILDFKYILLLLLLLLILRNPNNHYNHGFPNTFDYNYYVYSDYLVCSMTAIAHIIRY